MESGPVGYISLHQTAESAFYFRMMGLGLFRKFCPQMLADDREGVFFAVYWHS
jgi:hypothetical protein